VRASDVAWNHQRPFQVGGVKIPSLRVAAI
jgi:hypothetical protein